MDTPLTLIDDDKYHDTNIPSEIRQHALENKCEVLFCKEPKMGGTCDKFFRDDDADPIEGRGMRTPYKSYKCQCN